MLVSQYIELKKAGRNYRGLSPFTSEKSPSFFVSPEKEIAYCFSTNQGGDIFAFYQLVESCSFIEALKSP
jgi:DNA primase